MREGQIELHTQSTNETEAVAVLTFFGLTSPRSSWKSAETTAA